jgi:hypothetical protein
VSVGSVTTLYLYALKAESWKAGPL